MQDLLVEVDEDAGTILVCAEATNVAESFSINYSTEDGTALGMLTSVSYNHNNIS